MPNINFWVKDQLYSDYVNVDKEQKQKLKKKFRKMVEKLCKESQIAGKNQ
jgi:pyoverdine/dityrosine biosynthesis protein Dit1